MSEQVNYLAILIAIVASMAIGAAWYGILAKPWMRAAGLSEEQIKRDGSVLAYGVAVISHAIMAYVLVGVIYHAVGPAMTVRAGMLSAFFIWGGFIFTSMALNHRFQLKPWSLTLIDSGHYLLVMLAQGAIIGWFGVKA